MPDDLNYQQILDECLLDATDPMRVGLKTQEDMQALHMAGLLLRYRETDPQQIETAIMESRKSDPFCIKVMRHVMNFYIAKNIPLTEPLRQYADDVAADKIKPRGGKTTHTNWFRDGMIFAAVNALMRVGVSENKSAQIVSISLSERGYTGIGDEAVRQIMKKERKKPV